MVCYQRGDIRIRLAFDSFEEMLVRFPAWEEEQCEDIEV